MPLPAHSTRENNEAVIMLVCNDGESPQREARLAAIMLSGSDDTEVFFVSS